MNASASTVSVTRIKTDDVVFVVALCIAGFGYVLGFNQLATQSAIDALPPVALFAAGFAGLLNSSRALFILPASTPRRVVAIAEAILALYAIASVIMHLHVSQQAIATGACGLAGLLALALRSRERTDRTTDARDQIRTMAAFAQVLLLGYFSILTLLEAHIGPFA